MNNETTPEYSLPEGTIEEISKTFDKAYDTAIDHAIRVVIETCSAGGFTASTELILHSIQSKIISNLKKLKKP